MSIPAGTKFIGISADVDTYERKSAQANSPSNVYTIEDIVDGTVPDSRTITINGTTQDLSTDRTWTISTGITTGTTPVTSGTNGRVFFQAGGVVQQDGVFFWDNANKRLGIGTTPSASRLSVLSTNNTDADMQIRIGSTDAATRFYTIGRESANGQLAFRWGGEAGALGAQFYFPVTTFNTITSSSSDQATSRLRVANTGGGRTFAFIAGVHNTSQSNFSLYDETAGITRFIIDGSGNLALGTNTASPGARLDVRAQGALSTDIAFRVRNSADTDNLIDVAGNGLVKFRTGTERIEVNTTASDYKISAYKFGVEMTKISTYSSYFCYGGSGQYLGIGTNAPSHLLDIYSSATPILTRWTNDENNLAGSDVTLKFTTRYTGGSQGGNPMAYLTVGGTGAGVNTNNKSYFKFLLSKANTLAERASITSQSNLLLQAPTEDTNDIGVIYIPNGTAPTVALAGGGKLYVEGGALKYIGSSGTITTVAPA